MIPGASAQPAKIDPKLPPSDLPVAVRDLWSPLGLPRLKERIKPGKPVPLGYAAYEVDALDLPLDAKAAEGIREIQRGKLRVLEIDSTREWSAALQKAGNAPGCVSFLLYASDATVVAVDGAWLGVAHSPVTGCLQLMIGESSPGGIKWREAGLNVLAQTYGGETMAAFSVLTVRLDPKAGVWDLYNGSTQIADNLALAKTTSSDPSHGKFLVRSGKGKSWLCGLVQTADNPLFDDANGNGIDDEFERTKKGGLLPASLAPAQRTSVAQEWREFARTQRYEAWRIDKPRPD